MTTQDMLNSIKCNIGNRVTGTIGGFPVDTVVLQGINKALYQVLSKYNPDYYNRSATLAIDTTNRVYTLPTSDLLGNFIRIKDILSFRCSRADGTQVVLAQLNYVDFVKATPNFTLVLTGVPRYFAIWEGKLILDYISSQALTLAMYVESYPITLTISDLNYVLPVEENWEMMIEAYATSHVYLKLQQTQMAQTWMMRYTEQTNTVPGSIRQKQTHGISSMGHIASISDPVNNPLVNGWN